MSQAMPVLQCNCRITNNIDDVKGSDIIIITAGIPRKPGMSRDDLLFTNRDIIRSLVEKIAPLSPGAVLIMVTNPLDAMCHVAREASGFPRNRVVGMAGVLDSSRFAAFIAMELGVSIENVQAFVLGGHGDAMVPLPRYTNVAGIPVTKFMSRKRLNDIIERTRNGGAEITNLLKVSSAYYAPASAIREMAEAVLKDKKKIMPCSAYLEGEYGIKDLFVGVPVKLGSEGIEQIIEVELSSSEKAAFGKSADRVKVLLDAMNGHAQPAQPKTKPSLKRVVRAAEKSEGFNL